MVASGHGSPEAARLRALHDLGILDSEREPAFEAVTRHLADLFDAPVARITLVDEARTWFKASHGSEGREGCRKDSFCSLTIGGPDCFAVEDAAKDPRFTGWSKVKQGKIRFYAGAPIRVAGGHAVGTICMSDRIPREFTADMRDALVRLAAVVAFMVQIRRKAALLEAALADRKVAEDSVNTEREAAIRLAVAVQHSQDAVIVYDRSGAVDYVNKAFCQMAGFTQAEVLGTPHPAARVGVDPPVESEDVRLAFSRGKGWSGMIELRRKDGELYRSESSISPIRDKDSKVAGFVEVRRDMTEQERLRNRLNTTQRLESIGRLAAGIAHEINTPIQFVGDNTRFLKDGFQDLHGVLNQLTERDVTEVSGAELGKILEQGDADYLAAEIPRAIEQTIEGIDRVSTIVQAMKAFSHPSTEKSLSNLGDLIRNTVTVANSVWKYVADVEIEVDPNMPPVPCVPGEINQVILNMVVNAAHAIEGHTSESGEQGLIRISAGVSGGMAQIDIADNGGGIPAEVAERIFDPFFTTKSVGVGTGQGLFLAQETIRKKHGGAIAVESTPGTGTTFTIRLPLEAA